MCILSGFAGESVIWLSVEKLVIKKIFFIFYENSNPVLGILSKYPAYKIL